MTIVACWIACGLSAALAFPPALGSSPVAGASSFAPPQAGGDDEASDAGSNGDTSDDDSDAPSEDDAAVRRARIERLIDLASTGRAVVRPQAAQRLVDYGDEAAAILVARVGEVGDALEDLGPELVEVLGEFDDDTLRARLWWQLDSPSFPWRPQAARSLAKVPHAEELARFHALIDDRHAQVREAAVKALAALGRNSAPDGGPGPSEVLLRGKLSDPDDAVRRAAAITLYDWGDPATAFWLLEDLRRDDRFFELRTGERARFASASLLEQRFEDLAGFDPALDPADLDARLAWRKLEERLLAENDGERPALPDVAKARVQRIDAVFGLELRSCRHGDLFLRWTADDELFVGTGRAARVALPPGTVRTLLGGVDDRLQKLGRERFWGVSGCDTEQLHWRPPGAERTATFLVSKGAQPVDDLRPGPLSDVARALLATLPDGANDDPRLARLKKRATDTLSSIGGPTGSR